MGNRAVITTRENFENNGVGIYIHWNGGRESVDAFLKYCELQGYIPPEQDCYGWASLAKVISNFFGGGESIGIDQVSNLDCDNFDNGVYIIENWKVVDRRYRVGVYYNHYSHGADGSFTKEEEINFLLALNESMNEKDRLDEEVIINSVTKVKARKIVCEVESSVISEVAYNPKSMELTITFNAGSEYIYRNVEETVFEELINADSVGRYFCKNIKGRYESERL